MYNFNSHQPILVISGRNVAEGVPYQMVVSYPTFSSYVSALPGETWTPEMVFSVPCLDNNGASACYIVHTHQPNVIILCRQ